MYSMSFCFLIEVYNKGSFIINTHMCTDPPSRDCKKPIVCKHKNNKAKKIDLAIFLNAFMFPKVADWHAV